MMLVRIHSVLTPEQRRGLDAIAKRHAGRAESPEAESDPDGRQIFTISMEFVMLGRKLVAAASFVVFVSGAASAQTAAV